jgi:hypothetical protein
MSENKNQDVRYTYVRDTREPERVLTIARRWGRHGKIHYAYALCRPDTDQFRKDIGRKIASGRLLTKPTKILPDTNKNALRYIMQDISNKEDTPCSVRRIVKDWISSELILYSSTIEEIT